MNETFQSTILIKTGREEKAKYARAVYDEIRAMSPPGRFLKQDPETLLWYKMDEKNGVRCDFISYTSPY